MNPAQGVGISRSALGVAMCPDGRGIRWLPSCILLAAGTVLVFLRQGGAAFRGVVWAEDGAVFLQDAYQHGAVGSLFEPYAGYLHLAPRVVTAVIEPFPLAWHGVLVCLAGAVVQSAVATFSWNVLRAHVGGVAALVGAVAVIAVPVGPEAIENIANAQWFLLFAGCLAPLWRPSRAGRAASIGMMLAATTSSPFGVLALGVAALAWVLSRTRGALVLLVVGALGALVQVVVMLTAPAREIPINPLFGAGTLSMGYLRRVLGDGVFGAGADYLTSPSTALVPGVLVLGFVTMLLVTAARTHGVVTLVMPLLMLVLSIGSFLAPVIVSGLRVDAPLDAGRYYVTPALFLMTATALLLDSALRDLRSRTAIERQLAGTLALGLALSMAFGFATSWVTPEIYRVGGPSWSAEVSRGRVTCADDHLRKTERLDLAPADWVARVPCTVLLGH